MKKKKSKPNLISWFYVFLLNLLDVHIDYYINSNKYQELT